MPEFVRDIYIDDYETYVTVESNQEFEVTPEQFLEACHASDIDEIIEALSTRGYDVSWWARQERRRSQSPEEYLNSCDAEKIQQLIEVLTQRGTDINDLLRSQQRFDKDTVEEAIELLMSLDDNEFFGLPDEELDRLRKRLGVPEPAVRVQVPERPRHTRELNQILSSIQPNQPIPEAMLNEIRLLAQ